MAVIVVCLEPEPLAVSVSGRGPCADCGLDLDTRTIGVFDHAAGIICTDCLEWRRGNLERRIDCSQFIQLGPRGIRMAPGGRSVHLCPASEQNTYALCSQLIDEREWRKANAA